MANNRIQVKRTSVSGRTANVTNSGNSQYIAAGELALNMPDGILYTSNGSSLIEVGANNTKQNISTNNLTVGNTLYVVANGNVGIGVTNPQQKLSVSGAVRFSGSKFANGIAGTNLLLYTNGVSQGERASLTLHSTFEGTGDDIPRRTADIVAGFNASAWGAEFLSFNVGGSNDTFITTTERVRITGNGNVGIGTTSPAYKLQVNGSFAATTKSFVIDHPTKPDMKLRYGSLEGPENGVYVRGRLDGKSIIELPEYWWNLIDERTITVNLTPIGRSQDIWVQSTSAYFIHLNQPADCFFTVFAERKDVDKLVVEF